MIDIEIDGFPCKKCNTMHPTLHWHNLYDDYLKTKEDYFVYIKEAYKRFGGEISDEEAFDNYYEYMRIRGLAYSEKTGECAVCKTNTHYTYVRAKAFVCSDKCKYELL